MNNRLTFLLCIMILSSLLMAACLDIGGNTEPNPTEIKPNPPMTPTHSTSATVQANRLATPVSQQPAAGICGAVEGDIVTVRINPDVPDPRCVIITSDQRLKVINNRDEIIQINLGVFEAEIDPGDEILAPLKFGEYLAPGVHLIEVSPCCGASLWLQEEDSLTPKAELALQALNDFFNQLQTGRYPEAALHYGGEYNVLRDQNPEIDPDDYAALFQKACTINGAMCLKIRSVELWNHPSPREFRFSVEFENPDGSLFILGPCCGATNPSQPHLKEFIYTVKLDDLGRYVVMELPVYLP